jgi:ABC-2 type transport system ATP-binding protein
MASEDSSTGPGTIGRSVARCETVCFQYGLSRPVFTGLDLTISTGITGLLGPNGAGKSTLLGLLGTRLAARSGRVTVLDQDAATAAGRAAIRRRIGVLPQRYPLVGSITALDTVAYAAWAQGLSRRDAYPAAETALGDLEAADLAGRRVRTLSGGQRQRVGLATAIAHQPDFLILDEPTAGLDPEIRIALRRTLRAMSSRRSILLSTHLVDDVLAICDSIIVLDRGHVLFQGKPTELSAMANRADPDTPGSDLEKGYEALLVRGRTHGPA